MNPARHALAVIGIGDKIAADPVYQTISPVKRF
jgi:hypothetical protein